MYEFLLLLGLIWLVIASVFDIKKREVPNWLSFSLIIFALAYRLIYAVSTSNLMFFIYGLFGFFLFFILAYIFYYARVFAGGDAKLLMGIGPVLSLAPSFFRNIMILGVFILILLLIGSMYGLVFSFVLVLKNKKNFVKEFSRQFKLRRTCLFVSLAFAFFSLAFIFYVQEWILFFLPLIFLVLPFLYIYAKSVEEACMIKIVSSKEVTVGDWLYKEVEVGRKKIKPYWEGLSEDEIRLLRKYKGKVKIKQGIPFVPVFLISFILLLLIAYLRD